MTIDAMFGGDACGTGMTNRADLLRLLVQTRCPDSDAVSLALDVSDRGWFGYRWQNRHEDDHLQTVHADVNSASSSLKVPETKAQVAVIPLKSPPIMAVTARRRIATDDEDKPSDDLPREGLQNP